MTLQKRSGCIAYAALFGSVLCWGSVPLLLKYFTAYIDAWTANGVRYPFAALLLLPWLIREYRAGRLPAAFWRLALLPAFFNLSSQILWAWTPYFVDPGLISFLVRLSTLWAVVGSFILFVDERPIIRQPHFWGGLLFALLGFVLMVAGGSEALGSGKKIGIVLVVLCSLLSAAYQLMVRRYLSAVDARTAYGMVAALTAAGLLVLMFAVGQPQQVTNMPPGPFLLLMLSGIVGLIIAHIFFYTALRHFGVAVTSSVNLLSALITATASRFLFAEQLSPVQWLAGLFLLGGCLLLAIAPRFSRKTG
ncbi:MAG TPA: DMT family transporter [bacterium]|nr:DMT family transporter [bacterium]HPG45571.1 DMT family transporter [bacterium]HPM97650.1 DMT family transporter [bacterium]